LKLPVVLDKDVQLGILAEHRLGAGKDCEHILGVFFGTGVGGAMILNGSLYRGASGVGGQVGAILAQPVGGPEAALSHGILDRIASKAAIASEALVMAIKDWAPYLHKKVEADLSKVSWGILKRAIAHGDRRIEEMLRARMKVVGIALSSIVNFLNPQMLVLGGGLMDEMPKLVLNEVSSGLREYLVPEVAEVFKLRRARLGGHAVALGAADSAFRRETSTD
jgi:glucokinase